ncbi:hypothetical protein DAERI_060104 [Deinococcus aerius]|uniref:Uncharacterized protein n=1 Tax=Deinococcus aerius TaxID=200253 RepID=A0A2I9CV95_9DEIO|nr:hypothetical protein [Deinococcus aerius]GBF05844.1 hypothetical protein DAERI_060104 [Deinococcus aerius]
MELLTREQRGGEPVACAYGCRVLPDGRVRAGLLFARDGLGAPLLWIDPQTQTSYFLALPPDFRDLDEDGYGENEFLEPA